MLVARQSGTLSKKVCRKFITALLCELSRTHATPPVNWTIFHNAFVDVLRHDDKSAREFSFKDLRRRLPGAWTGHKAVSIQTCYAIHFWFADSGLTGIESEKPEQFVIESALKYFHDDKTRLPLDSVVGTPGEAAWITPVKRAGQIGRGQPDIDRDRLGLFRNGPPRHALVVTLVHDLGNLPSHTATLHAPTVFDARGYERFRHWPRNKRRSVPSGRTFDLRPSPRKASRPGGLPELIVPPVPLKVCADLKLDGTYDKMPASDLASHTAYATALAGRSDIASLLEKLSDHV
jgi:hypothetical protein